MDERVRRAEKEIGPRLRRARVAAGIKPVDAARALGVRRAAIYEMEDGRRRCRAEELPVLANLYQVPMNWIVGKRRNARDERVELAAAELTGLSTDALDQLSRAIKAVKRRKPS